MSKTILATDIGNTTIQCGVFSEGKLITSWRLTSELTRSSDECWHLTSFFCQQAGIDPTTLQRLAIASVVPRQTLSFQGMAIKHFDPEPLDISYASCPFLDIKYNNPLQVGADRLCNAFAGYHFYRSSLIVVDFGTSITFDVVNEAGAYLGGVIIPGPQTAARALHRRTAQLPQVSITFPDSIIGQSTEHAIQAGLTWGIVDMVDSIIDRIAKEFSQKPKVIATGGYAENYAGHSRNFSEVHPDLVLEGIRLISDRAAREQK